MNSLQRTRIEKAAADCGFERTAEFVDGTIVLRSALFPEFIELELHDGESFLIKSMDAILLPGEGRGAAPILVQGWAALYEVLEKAAATARNLPNRVAAKFHRATQGMPLTTETERLVVQRIGQNLFRNSLLDFWQGRCCVIGLAVPELLRASHIRPWAMCETDEQRLDVFNGLLLSPNLDALFDGGWVSFDDGGNILVAEDLADDSLELLGLTKNYRLNGLKPRHLFYLDYHRKHVFRLKRTEK
jgi:putative restriction endonuclease